MENFIITIARGYGSGGRTIGMKLTKELAERESVIRDYMKLKFDETEKQGR